MSRFTAFAIRHNQAFRVLSMVVAVALAFHRFADPVPTG